MISITYAPKFLRQLNKLKPNLKAEVKERIVLFKKNLNDSRLRTHKLHGELSDCWAFSINHQYRIVFEYLSEKEVGFLKVDDHDVYKR